MFVLGVVQGRVLQLVSSPVLVLSLSLLFLHPLPLDSNVSWLYIVSRNASRLYIWRVRISLS